MGSDFLLLLVPVPSEITPQVIAEFHRKIDLVPAERLGDIIQACLDEDDEYPAAKHLLHRAIAEVIGVDRRDVTEVTLGRTTYLASGGMSGGDPPTDAWRYLEALLISGLPQT